MYDFFFQVKKQKKSQRLNSVKNTGNHILKCVCLTAENSAGSRMELVKMIFKLQNKDIINTYVVRCNIAWTDQIRKQHNIAHNLQINNLEIIK